MKKKSVRNGAARARALVLAAAGLLTAVGQACLAEDLPSLNLAGLNTKPISLMQFLEETRKTNTALNSKRLEIDSATANVELMSMPYLSPSFSYSVGSYYRAVPYQPFISPQSNTYSFSATIEAPGKREAREAFANGEVGRHRQELLALQRNIEFDAALSYIDALRSKILWQIYERSVRRLSGNNDQRASDILKEDQSNQKTAGRDIHFQSLGLYGYLGRSGAEIIEPVGSLSLAARQFDLAKTIQQALDSRADLQALSLTLASATNNLEMVKKNRRVDVGVGFSISDTPGYTSSGTTYNKTSTHGFSFSVPIPFQQISDADVRQAGNTRTQIEINIRDLKARIQSEVTQNHLRYLTAAEQLQSAVRELNEVRAAANKNDSSTLVTLRDKEIALLDAETAHVKALVGMLKAAGNYAIPPL